MALLIDRPSLRLGYHFPLAYSVLKGCSLWLANFFIIRAFLPSAAFLLFSIASEQSYFTFCRIGALFLSKAINKTQEYDYL